MSSVAIRRPDPNSDYTAITIHVSGLELATHGDLCRAALVAIVDAFPIPLPPTEAEEHGRALARANAVVRRQLAARFP